MSMLGIARDLGAEGPVRLFVLAVIAVWLSISNPFPETLYYLALLCCFALLGLAWLWLTSADEQLARILAFRDEQNLTDSLQIITLSDHGHVSTRGDALDIIDGLCSMTNVQRYRIREL